MATLYSIVCCENNMKCFLPLVGHSCLIVPWECRTFLLLCELFLNGLCFLVNVLIVHNERFKKVPFA